MDASTSFLKEQFHALQEQQKQRYRRRRAEQGTATTVMEASPDPAALQPLARGVDDNLQLLTAAEELGRAVIPESAGPDLGRAASGIDFLCNQVECLQLEVSEMNETLKKKDLDLSRLQELREEEMMAFGGSSSTATQRIVELSKRNREITAELTAEKNRVRQLHKKLKELSSRPDQKVEVDQKNERKKPPSTTAVEDEPTVIAKLQEQVLHGKQKTTEYRNQCQLLKQDLKLAHRVLAKEVGDGVSISALLSGVSGWRGRAQQIVVLQNKMAELKQQLDCTQGARKIARRDSDQVSSRIEARQKATLEKMEKDKMKNLEGSRMELEDVRAEYAKVQQQCNALKARNKLVSADVKTLKSQLATLRAKTTESGDLVVRSDSTSRGKPGTWEEDERERLRQDNRNLQNQLTKCRLEIQSLKQASRRPRDREETSTATERRDLQSTSGTGTSEPSGLSSISLPPIVNPRPPHKSHTQSLSLSHLRSLSAGQSICQQPDCTLKEAHALAQVAQVERKRLLELTSALQQRLDAATDRMIRLETNARNQRQVITRFEKQLGRRKHKHSSDESRKQPDTGELESELALQVNENAVLRETLELTRQEKMEDIKLFHSMLQEAKQIFIASVRRMQSCGGAHCQ